MGQGRDKSSAVQRERPRRQTRTWAGRLGELALALVTITLKDRGQSLPLLHLSL